MEMRQLDNLNLLSFIIKKDYGSIENYLERNYFDSNSFMNFVDKHQLSGNLYLALNNSHLRSLFPVDLIEHFKSIYIQQWAKNEKLVKEIKRLAELFVKFGQEVIFLKGPFLAERFYGDLDRRAISDIDILVKKEAIDSAEQLLVRDGFQRDSVALINKKLAIYFTHHFEYRKRDIDLELHWALANHFSFNINYEKIWEQKQKFIFKDRLFYILPDEYELVFQLLSIFKDIQIGTIALKSFVDIYMILKAIDKNLNWKEFFDNRKEERLFSISLNTLDLVLDIFDCHKNFIGLSEYIEKNRTAVKYKVLNQKSELLNRSRCAFKNKLWAFGLYQTSIFKSFSWWAISLPFRLAMHREWSRELLRR